MGMYNTIRQTRKIINDLYNAQSHAVTCKMIGINLSLYNEIRYYNTVTVAQKITPELHTRLKDFVELHTIPKPEVIKETIKEEPIKPRDPVEVFVNNDVENVAKLKLNGRAMDMVKAMSDLRKAMDPFFDMGYHIGVTLYKKVPVEELE